MWGNVSGFGGMQIVLRGQLTGQDPTPCSTDFVCSFTQVDRKYYLVGSAEGIKYSNLPEKTIFHIP